MCFGMGCYYENCQGECTCHGNYPADAPCKVDSDEDDGYEDDGYEDDGYDMRRDMREFG